MRYSTYYKNYILFIALIILSLQPSLVWAINVTYSNNTDNEESSNIESGALDSRAWVYLESTETIITPGSSGSGGSDNGSASPGGSSGDSNDINKPRFIEACNAFSNDPVAESCLHAMAYCTPEIEYLAYPPNLGVGRVKCNDFIKAEAAEPSESAPVVVTVTQSDFATLEIPEPTVQIGPPSGYLPIGLEAIAYTDAAVVEKQTTILNTPVTIKAIPMSYEWHFGDGTILSSSFPGKAHPARDISMRYRGEGWYEAHLVIQYAGEYSVNGGEFKPINGTISKTVGHTWIYSDARTARLVSSQGTDPQLTQIPERSSETMGPQNPQAEVKKLNSPRTKNYWERQQNR